MTSRLTKAAIEEMWANGLKPSVEDIVRLNALGLAAEHCGLGGVDSLPLVSHLGDLAFVEPTIAKRIYLDLALSQFRGGYIEELALVAYILNTPSNQLPPTARIKQTFARSLKFLREHLLTYTTTEILAAIKFALGSTSADSGELPEASKQEKEAEKNAADIYSAIPASNAQALLAEAVAEGISPDVANILTSTNLRGILATAKLTKGAHAIEWLKNTKLGEFNRTWDSIQERLQNGEK